MAMLAGFIPDHDYKNQFGTQTAALISPNSRAILRQDAPASSLTYTSPNRLNATMRLASAGCVARPHTVALGWVGSGRISQVSPMFVVRSTCPFSPVVVSAHPANRTPGSSLAADFSQWSKWGNLSRPPAIRLAAGQRREQSFR